MEKFSQFCDSTTGIHPFLPNEAQADHSWLGIIKRYLFHALFLPIFLLRVLTLLVAAVYICSVSTGCSILGYLSSYLHYHVTRILLSPAYRLILYNFGIRALRTKFDNPQLDALSDAQPLKRATGELVGNFKSSFFLSTFSGFMDVLYLTCEYNPFFVIITAENQFKLCEPAEMMLYALQNTTISFKNKPLPTRMYSSFTDLLKCATKASRFRPIVVFPEGAKSQANCILNWKLQAFRDQDVTSHDILEVFQHKCNLVSIQYESLGSFAPPHTIYSGLYHVFRLLMEPYNLLIFTYTDTSQISRILALQKPDLEQCLKTLRRTMGYLVKESTKLVDVDGDQLNDFTNFFNATQAATYKKSN